MREFIKTLEEAQSVEAYVRQQFGNIFECCGLVCPAGNYRVEVLEPLQSCFVINPNWGVQGLVDGCIPPGIYRLMPSLKNVNSRNQHLVELEVEGKEEKIIACFGYTGRSMIDWRGTRPVAD